MREKIIIKGIFFILFLGRGIKVFVGDFWVFEIVVGEMWILIIILFVLNRIIYVFLLFLLFLEGFLL